MSEYKSLHERLLEKGYVVDNYFQDNKLPEDLTVLALDLARGRYDQVRIIPADLALEGEKWIPTDKLHLVYATLSEAEKKNREGTAYMLRMVMCRHADTGELNFVPFPEYNRK